MRRVLPRPRHLDRRRILLVRNPAVAILGARQVGKTTLAGQILDEFSGPTTRFDLEDPGDLARLAEPRLALEEHRCPGGVLRPAVNRR